MHGHAHDHEHDAETAARARGTGADDRPDAPLWRAAAAGRSEVVGREGLLRLQRALGNSGAAALVQRETEERSPVLDVVGSGGRPLPALVRADMEARLGADFSDVRVHDDGKAHESAVAVGAHAYTVGNDVVFQRDALDLTSTAGRTTLAHELTHVVQQRSGPVDGTPTGDGVSVSDPSDRFEREAVANAERVVASPAPAAGVVAAGAADRAGTAVQRAVEPGGEEEVPDEQPLQGSFVQRLDASVQRDDDEEDPA